MPLVVVYSSIDGNAKFSVVMISVRSGLVANDHEVTPFYQHGGNRTGILVYLV